ncbi:MAG TPA: hypothetical protein VK053_01990 [Jiangellaceae bacterium]|nr:hypothetical protein [Jiangellaceae bacterium]
MLERKGQSHHRPQTQGLDRLSIPWPASLHLEVGCELRLSAVQSLQTGPVVDVVLDLVQLLGEAVAAGHGDGTAGTDQGDAARDAWPGRSVRLRWY